MCRWTACCVPAAVLLVAVSAGGAAAQERPYRSDAASAVVTVVTVVNDSGEVSFTLPQLNHFASGPGHSPELCIHPNPHPPRAQDDDPNPQPVHNFYRHEEEAPEQCVVHAADALNVCAQLPGCAAMTCLPTQNFDVLDPPQVETAGGGIIGHRPDSATLIAAAREGRYDAAQRVLEEGNPDVDAVEPVGLRTALMFAVMRGDVAMVELLLAHGADTDLVDAQQQTAMDYSRQHNVYRPHQTAGLEEGNTVDTDEMHKDVAHRDIDVLLAARHAALDLARRRVRASDVRSQEHHRVLVRTMVASTPRARQAERLLAQRIQAPTCLARGHTEINRPNSQRCSQHRSEPGPRCTNLLMHERRLVDVIDMNRVPAPVARRLHPGLSAGRTLLALPGGGDLDGETWFEPWRQRSDWVGVVPASGGGEVTLVFVVKK